MKYFVKAVSGNYAGASGISNTLLVGTPSELPFVENFDKQVGDYIEAEHSSWQLDGSEGTTNWAFAEMAYLINEGQVIPVNGGKGLAYAYYGPYSDALRDDYMTSGNINVADCDKLFVSFYLYAVRDIIIGSMSMCHSMVASSATKPLTFTLTSMKPVGSLFQSR